MIKIALLLGCIILLLVGFAYAGDDTNCVCAECGWKCGSGHAKTCSSYQKYGIVVALQDCRWIKNCPDRCLCQYNNCCSGCDNLGTALERSNCLNKCISSWQDCNGRCR